MEAGVMADEDAKANEKQETGDDAAQSAYSPSTAQLDAERRAAELNPEGDVDPAGQVVGHRVAEQPKYGVEEGYGYLGTDPVYQNSADERGRPFTSEEDWQRKLMVPPAEDAGQPTLPYVPGTRPGGPSVETTDHDWTGEPEKSDSQEGDGDKDGEDGAEQKPAAKAAKSVPTTPKKSTAPAK